MLDSDVLPTGKQITAGGDLKPSLTSKQFYSKTFVEVLFWEFTPRGTDKIINKMKKRRSSLPQGMGMEEKQTVKNGDSTC